MTLPKVESALVLQLDAVDGADLECFLLAPGMSIFYISVALGRDWEDFFMRRDICRTLSQSQRLADGRFSLDRKFLLVAPA